MVRITEGIAKVGSAIGLLIARTDGRTNERPTHPRLIAQELNRVREIAGEMSSAVAS